MRERERTSQPSHRLYKGVDHLAGNRMFERFRRGLSLDTEPMPGIPLVEMFGDKRVLIENHCGVSAYSDQEICIKVKHGCIHVCGSNLNLAQMSRERLVICGKIVSVQLVGRR